MSTTPVPDRLRVLLVCEWFVKYTAGLARGLADLDLDVMLLSRDHDLEFGGEPGSMREFVQSTLGDRAAHRELGGKVRDPSRAAEVVRLRRELRRWRPDAVHVQDSLPHDMRLAVAAGFPRHPYAITVHDPVPHPGDPWPPARIRFLRRELRRHAALVFVHSRTLAEELRAVGDVRGAVEVVPHGSEPSPPVPLPDRPSLLFFGRISRYKGLDVLLDAMPLVWRQRPEATLVVAGTGTLPSHETLNDRRVTVRAEHVPERDLPALFGGAACVVLPYRDASQSGVGSEAKRFGRAVVATRVGGLPELITPDWGVLVPPEDPTALAGAIVEVLNTPGLAEEMGRHAAASAGDSSWRSVAELTLAAYRRHLL